MTLAYIMLSNGTLYISTFIDVRDVGAILVVAQYVDVGSIHQTRA